MAIYSNGIKYGMAGYGKEFVGGDLVWQNGLAVGTIIVPTHSINLPSITYTFEGLKTKLSNTPTGIKINWHDNIPFLDPTGGKYTLNEGNYTTFDKKYDPDSYVAYLHLSDFVISDGLATPYYLSKSILKSSSSIDIKIPQNPLGDHDTSDKYILYRNFDGHEDPGPRNKAQPREGFFDLELSENNLHNFQITVNSWIDDIYISDTDEYSFLPLIDSIEVY